MSILSSGLKQFQSLGKVQNDYAQSEIRSLQESILSGRVKSINQSGEGNDGVISVEILNKSSNTALNIIPDVYPLFSNFQQFPLINEAVMLVALTNVNSNNNSIGVTYYYINSINLWNSIETNPLPLTNTENFKPGTYFIEQGLVNPLYSYEGDTVYSGRFGNNIRMGNTVPNGTTFVDNNWSITGSIGNPITIITNGLHPQSPSYNSITEDINKDKSSIYLTSTQQVPILVSSTNNYQSYSTPPTAPNQYSGEQIILNSGRLIFNTTQDHILLSSQKSINLNTVESVNIDAAQQTVIQTPELYLGGVKTAQPVVLGDDLVGLLTDVLSDLSTLTKSLQNQIGVPAGTPLGPTNLIAQTINAKIGGYKARLQNSLSQTTKTV
tara:strand:+ start:1822 stop:2967 length:1146 start_codon:yes stop_codon:yes gene_type:complete